MLIERIEQNVADMYGKGDGSPQSQIQANMHRRSILMMKRQESVISHNPTLFKEDDGVWRPILLTLGLLYKVQKVCDDGWYVNKEHFVSDSEKIENLMNGLAKYWWYHFEVSKCITRDIDDLDELKESMAQGLQKPVEDILYVYHKGSRKEEKGLLNEHIGDVSIVVDHEAKEVVLSVSETKVSKMLKMNLKIQAQSIFLLVRSFRNRKGPFQRDHPLSRWPGSLGNGQCCQKYPRPCDGSPGG